MNERTIHAATRVRRALEALRDRSPAVGLAAFPKGACRDASDLLARYLVDERIAALAALRTCWGQRGGDTHAWLEVNGRILDITADQFGEGCPAVWVPPDRRWHDAFKGGAAKEPDIFFEAAPHYASDMATAYVRVRQTIAFDQ